MTFEIGVFSTIALFAGALLASGLLFHFFSWWGRAAALSRARRIAARLRGPATTLADVEDQSAAIDDMVQFGNTEAAVSAARELLDTMDGAVRSAAIEVLRRTRALDRWSRDLRRGGYRMRMRAIDALGQVGDERAVAELVDALGDDDPHVARGASEAVLRRDPDYAIDKLAEALSSPNRRVAETAAATLVRLGEESAEALVGQLGSLSAQARRLSVESLGAIGAPRLRDLLLPLVESDPNPQVRVAVAEALTQTGDERTFLELRRLARTDPDWFVRCRAYSLLAEVNAPGAAEFLIDGLGLLQPEMAHRNGSGDAVEVIAEGSLRIRAAIIAGLRMLGMSDDEVAAAVRSADEPDAEVAAMAGEQSWANGWTETLAALTEADPARRAEAAGQLAEAGLPAVYDLRRALRDPDPLVRGEAARSLGRIGARDCLDSLAGALQDPDPGVRIACSTAMRAIVTRDAAQELRD